jgi:Asp-tRNA(Asn)/Glu-tRNA(Gln) amidotransferase A subunit family amidase
VTDDLGALDATAQAELVRRGDATPLELVDAAVNRIEKVNPELNAVIHPLFEKARAAAAGDLPDGPFRGVPIVVKDLDGSSAGDPMHLGNKLLKEIGYVADHDSFLAARLRAAGFVVVGKTNAPEFGLMPTTEPEAYGPTRNPWNTGYNTGGSSGGTASAVASGMVPLGHGGDGGGSIRIPSSACGLFGLKPTRGRVSLGPDEGEAWAGLVQRHALTRSVRDSAALLDASSGPAPGDPYWAPPPARPFLQEVGAKPGKLRIALQKKTITGTPIHPECVKGVEAAARLCEELGHRVEEAVPEFDFVGLRWAMGVVISANLRNALDARLDALKRAQREDDVERITALWAEQGRRQTARDYARALVIVHGVGRRFGEFFRKYDVLLSPTVAEPPLPLGATDMMSDDLDAYNERLFRLIPFTPQFNVSGGPAASIPLHWTPDGLPVGIQFGADFGNEAVLFRLAAQLEQAQPWKDKRPKL